ncbi:MAG: FAD-dependent monooxygenase [Geminocystis sp.]|nr:FAD-dependent monooxygenase [Geminocystis sp.]HIK37760.1 FAD-dependent monooxygenase [Geminocystis sp. M7585_C2015_104]MCS7148930.1 FAD-dependent monooxygenase [Geminocystis sp.]MCX8077447.1 FAD-dependent monooxygenase [Geminocystis sp.]MDW8117337.1 FAD-dependent monooxygenase [Geminocystis sp.]
MSEITIIGAGIAGLTLARCLEIRGIDFQLYEQAASFEALGYGLQISPNAVRVLQELSLASQLDTISHRCYEFELRDFHKDAPLARWQIDSDTPYYHCRRADLHRLLFDSLEDKGRIHFSHPLQSYEEKGDYLLLRFPDKEITTKALIGADGVHSSVRTRLFPNYRPVYSGYTAFRAILPFRDEYEPLWGKATVWMGANHHLVAYPADRKKKWLNLVLVTRERQWQEEGWKIVADREEIRVIFANKPPFLQHMCQQLDKSPEICYKWGLFIHPVLPYWSKGRITLVGDAAHPMVPFQAQGAAMAIESAYILARCLAESRDIESAFLQYQKLRKPRATRVQKTSRQNAYIFHASGLGAVARNLILTAICAINPQWLNWKTAWIYDYDVTARGAC